MNLNEAVALALTAGSPQQLFVTQDEIPQDVQWLPSTVWVTFQIVTSAEGEHLRGDDGQVNARVTVDVWSLDDTLACAGMRECRALMQAAPYFSAYTVGGFEERETDTRLYRVSRDFSVAMDVQ